MNKPFSPRMTPEARDRMREELRRRWYRSPWRIFPAPALAYITAGTYFWLIATPDAWLRALGPVLVVLVFTAVRPLVEHWWRTRAREKIRQEMRDSGEM